MVMVVVSLFTFFRRLKQQAPHAPPLIQAGLLSTYCVLPVFPVLRTQKGSDPLHSHGDVQISGVSGLGLQGAKYSEPERQPRSHSVLPPWQNAARDRM